MDYLARESADLPEALWQQIDRTVIDAIKEQIVCRRFLKLFGPIGPGPTSVVVDGVAKEEVLENGLGRIVGRTQLELPMIFEDFTILGRDLEYAKQTGYPLDLSSAARAAKQAARREDELILLGNSTLGTQGLVNAKGAAKIKKTDWKQGENGYADVAKAVAELAKNGYLGRYALVVSPDVYLDLQRLQPSLGMLEIDRVKKLIGDNVYMYGSFGTGKAVLVCAEPEYIDLAVGLDFSVGYVELADFNHHFRVMETAALRIKDPRAIVVFS
ncbi:family 1 encapsulin nanocompartment shell protein [Raoultibacter massiliensis]|uniref:Type 1 encapsulin shell protein n=1 Tax=Raoultibacter massiliensis TaxID=1852371 RepID=A0ABV1JCY4_9ACTN